MGLLEGVGVAVRVGVVDAVEEAVGETPGARDGVDEADGTTLLPPSGAVDDVGLGEMPGGPTVPGMVSVSDTGEKGPRPPTPLAATRNWNMPPGMPSPRSSVCDSDGYGIGLVLIRTQAFACARLTAVTGSPAAASSAAAVKSSAARDWSS